MSGLCKVEMSAFMGGAEGLMETERIALSQRERDRFCQLPLYAVGSNFAENGRNYMISDLRLCKCNIHIAARNKRGKGHIFAIFMSFRSCLRIGISDSADRREVE